MESWRPSCRRRPMQPSVRVLVALAMLSVGALVGPTSAFGAVSGGIPTEWDSDRRSLVRRIGQWESLGRGPEGTGGGGSGASPWHCIYTKLLLNDEGGIAPGGPTPGSWYSVTCTDRLTGASTTQTEWIPDQAVGALPAIDPLALALRAEKSLRLPSPVVHLNPSGVSVVNLPTWMWIDADLWHSYVVTATVGSVSVTAVATPVAAIRLSDRRWRDDHLQWSGGLCSTRPPPSPQPSSDCTHTYVISSGRAALARRQRR